MVKVFIWSVKGVCLCVQVYSATNVELVTRSRTEHLSDQDKSRSKGEHTTTLTGSPVNKLSNGSPAVCSLIRSSSFSGSKTPLQSFLGIAEQHTAHNGVRVSEARVHSHSSDEHSQLCLCPPARATWPSAPVLTTPQPSQPRSTSTQSSTWTAGTSDGPSSSPVKSRGMAKTPWDSSHRVWIKEANS